MTYVNIGALSFPAGAEKTIEERFTKRKQWVDTFDGFEGFELWRPVAGEDRYFVVTRWADEDAFKRWIDARSEKKAAEAAAAGDSNYGPDKSGMDVTPLNFEVVDLG
ncbi:antibiotic biosynthesis monooxygenase family protein [Corynebacterium variabile]|uniref:antibiotic biosynthesis monooxygenase family protein n=1 Tax=Corynebacterium variabile TaxID=1727 RepID=UPI003FD3C3E3